VGNAEYRSEALMKAIQMVEFGGPEVLKLRDVPVPIAGPGEVVVDIHAASLNPADIKVRKGLAQKLVKLVFPHVPGRDFSGVVRTVGPQVTEFRPGDEVFGITALGIEGAYAEAICISSTLIAPRPAGLTHAETAALALTSHTMLVCLEDHAHLARGETILIQGGAGGLGSVAVQYAKHVGATIFATASAHNHDYVRGLGADHVIDYATEDFVKLVPPCDVAFDVIGGDVQRRCVLALRPGGRLVHVAPSSPPDLESIRRDVSILRPLVKRDRLHLDRIRELIACGALRPPMIRRMPLAEAPVAHALLESRQVTGKIVFDVR
jgi:NADPH:quinone reductase-like Zn-dependent oxidoreductase